MKNETIDFGGADIASLFRKIFFPTVLGMLSVSAVTAIDGIFVGHGVGSDGIAAVNICIPLLMFLTGAGLMIGMGSSVVASIHLSKGKAAAARASVTQAMLTVTVVGTAVVALVMLMPDAVAETLGASPHLLQMTVDYLVWFAPSLIFELWIAVAQFVLRLDGAPRLAMWCSIVAAAINVALDWLFIFPFGWGVMGAAAASTISCAAGAVTAVAYLLFGARTMRLCPLHVSRKSLAFYFGDTARQCKVGSSALLGEATMAVLMFMGNHVFMRYLGDNGVGAFGISCYYLPFVFMTGNSIAQSAQPIISFNYGLGDRQRVRSALRISLTAAVVCGSLSAAAFTFCPQPLVALFLEMSDPAAQIAADGLPYYSAGFVFFILNLTVIGYFQSVERVNAAATFALLRGIVFLVPLFLLLPDVLGTAGIWLAMPFSESLTSLCVAAFFASRKAMRAKTRRREASA